MIYPVVRVCLYSHFAAKSNKWKEYDQCDYVGFSHDGCLKNILQRSIAWGRLTCIS